MYHYRLNEIHICVHYLLSNTIISFKLRKKMNLVFTNLNFFLLGKFKFFVVYSPTNDKEQNH